MDLKNKRSISLAWFLVAAMVVTIAAQSFALGRMAPRSTAVATVNLEGCFERSKLREEEDQRRAAIAEEMQVNIDEFAAQIDTLSEELELYAAGSEKHQTTLESLQQLTLDYQAYAEFSRRKLDIEKAITHKRVYLAIKEAARAVGAEMGYDIIFVNDSLSGIASGTELDVRRQIEARRMLYVNEEIDLTDLIVARMNA